MQQIKANGSKNILYISKIMLRWIVALTPMLGAIISPLLVAFTIATFGIDKGILLALLLIVLWFVVMLRTSEMPH